MSAREIAPAGSHLLPWSALALTLTAFAALHLTAGNLPLLYLLGMAVLAAHVVRARVPEGPIPLFLGLGLLLAAIVMTPDPGENGALSIGPARARNLFGEVTAIGMTLQFWIRRPRDPGRALLYLLLFGGLTILTASNTYDERHIRLIAPVFVVFGMLVLRATRPRARRDRIGAALLGVSLLSALAVGAVSMRLTEIYRSQIMEWGNRLVSDRPQTDFAGITDQPVLGPMFGMQGTARRVLRVTGYSGGHLRGAAFPTYQNGRWNPPIGSRSYIGFTPDQDVVPPRQGRRGAEIQVERLVPENPILYAPLSARQIDIVAEGLTDWDPGDGGPITVRRGAPLEYAFRDLGDGGQGILARPPSASEQALMKIVPSVVAQSLTPVARRVVAGARTDREKAQRIADYLMDRHPYSLTFRPRRGDPVVDFVTREGEAAHCEFFASAAALLLRCVGVPTRYVVGYYAHEIMEDQVLVVRQRDAHAWVEAWVDGEGWMTVEATPPTGMPDQHGTDIELWRRVTEGVQDLWVRLRDHLATITPDQVVWVLLLPVAVVPLVYVVRNRRRRRAAQSAGYPIPPDLETLARRFEALLQRRGIVAEPHRPWSAQLRALPDDDPFRAAAAAFVALYDAGRFGAATDRAALERALDAAAAIDSPAPPALPSKG